jgi:hypothetical protein
VTALFETEDPFVHRHTFGIGHFNLNTREFTFDPIGTVVPGKNEEGSIVRLSADRKFGYTVASYGMHGDKTCQFWSFDIPQKKLLAKSDFTCNTRFYFSNSYDGNDLLIFGAGFEIGVYDAATLKLKKTVNLKNDVTMAGMIIVPPPGSQVASR